MPEGLGGSGTAVELFLCTLETERLNSTCFSDVSPMVNWVYLGRICDLSGEERDRVVGYLAPDDSWEWEMTPMGEPGLAARLEAVRSVYSDAGSTTVLAGAIEDRDSEG